MITIDYTTNESCYYKLFRVLIVMQVSANRNYCWVYTPSLPWVKPFRHLFLPDIQTTLPQVLQRLKPTRHQMRRTSRGKHSKRIQSPEEGVIWEEWSQTCFGEGARRLTWLVRGILSSKRGKVAGGRTTSRIGSAESEQIIFQSNSTWRVPSWHLQECSD